ncbi:MAG: hypothetical protein R8P61_28340 [Bacteroidia bacterium]|nr:hypothetical protein [Bacteroidia bacterium]
MIKDKFIKEDVVRYLIQKEWYPQMEVKLQSRKEISTSRKELTDLDVLGLVPNTDGKLFSFIYDCKSSKKISAITRVFWIKGVMDFYNAKKGTIILGKDNLEKDHKLVAEELGIHLFSVTDFETFSKATADYLNVHNSALAMGDHWDKYFALRRKYPRLETLIDYLQTGFWNETESNVQLRTLVSNLRSMWRELNPDNPDHRLLILDSASMFAISLNQIVVMLFNQSLTSFSKDELDADLKAIIWGGVENYAYWDQLRKRAFSQQSGDDEYLPKDLSLPNWPKFLELVRKILSKPNFAHKVPIILKEQAFMNFDTNTDWSYSNHLVSTNAMLVNFAIATLEYLVQSTKIPKEFSENGIRGLMGLLPE